MPVKFVEQERTVTLHRVTTSEILSVSFVAVAVGVTIGFFAVPSDVT